MTALDVALAVIGCLGWTLALALLIGCGIAIGDQDRRPCDHAELGHQTWMRTETIRKSGRR